MREMWSIGEDALHGLDVAEHARGVVGHLRDIWFSPLNSKTVNLAREVGHDVKNMELAGAVTDWKDGFTILTNFGIFAMRAMMLPLGMIFDFMIVSFNFMTKMALTPLILLSKKMKLDYHLPRSIASSPFDPYPANEHRTVSRAI